MNQSWIRGLLSWDLGGKYHVSRGFLHAIDETDIGKLTIQTLALRLQQLE